MIRYDADAIGCLRSLGYVTRDILTIHSHMNFLLRHNAHLWIEDAKNLDGGDVHVDDLMCVGARVQQASSHAIAEQNR